MWRKMKGRQKEFIGTEVSFEDVCDDIKQREKLNGYTWSFCLFLDCTITPMLYKITGRKPVVGYRFHK